MPTKPDSRSPVVFAHPSEAEIARLLDFYHVAWQYEPRSFPLEWDAEGRPTQSFTPDFYLPDYDLFLEVTTIKPGLTHRKNRKIRKLRERYPNVMIKLLALKDVEALLLKYGRRIEGEPEEAGQARKNLSDMELLTDCTVSGFDVPDTSSASTDLATHRSQAKRRTA